MFPAPTSTESNYIVKIMFLFTLHLWNNQRIKQSSFYSNYRLQPIYRAFCQHILCLKIKKQNFANLHFLFRESNISPYVYLILTLHPPIYLAYDAATQSRELTCIEPSVLCISIDLTENGIESNLMMQLALWIQPVIGMCVSESKTFCYNMIRMVLPFKDQIGCWCGSLQLRPVLRGRAHDFNLKWLSVGCFVGVICRGNLIFPITPRRIVNSSFCNR